MRGLFKNGVNENIDAVSTYVKLVAFHSKTPCTALSNKMEATQRLFFYCEINSIPKIFRENDFTKKTEGFLEMRSVKILMLLVEVVVHCIQRRRRRPFQQNEGHTKAAFLPTTYIVLYSRSISCCWNILSAVVTAFFLQYSATLLLSAKLGGPVSPSLKV